jgi:alkylation response protein AidB-like acyl-CoA dehydrogenase
MRAGGSFLYEQCQINDIFTPEELNDEHRMIAETAKQFVEKEVDLYNKDIENQDFERVVILLKKAGKLGLLAHSVPEAFGGLGLDKMTKGLIGEIVGHASGYGVAHSNHTMERNQNIAKFIYKAGTYVS